MLFDGSAARLSMEINMDEMAFHGEWSPATFAQRYETIDMHTGGEPLRVVVSGLPRLPGDTVLEKRRWFSENLDHVRTALMWEPRGHSDMYGAIVTPAADGDFDIFFLHNEGYSTMCGHAVIALTRLVVESGMVSGGRQDVIFNAPCGRIVARARMERGNVVASSFRNVPCYVAHSDASVHVPGLGIVNFDIAFGGAYYAIVDAGSLDLGLGAESYGQLIDYGQRIKVAVRDQFPIVHPFEPDLSFLYGTIFTGPAQQPGHHSRNVCIFADGEVDRSATGSGVSARAALHYANGELTIGETITIESILGSTMDVKVVEQTDFAGWHAIVPEVEGKAHFIGRCTFWIEPDDQLGSGFLLH